MRVVWQVWISSIGHEEVITLVAPAAAVPERTIERRFRLDPTRDGPLRVATRQTTRVRNARLRPLKSQASKALVVPRRVFPPTFVVRRQLLVAVQRRGARDMAATLKININTITNTIIKVFITTR